MYFITANQLLESASSGCYAITQALLRKVLRKDKWTLFSHKSASPIYRYPSSRTGLDELEEYLCDKS